MTLFCSVNAIELYLFAGKHFEYVHSQESLSLNCGGKTLVSQQFI